MQHALVRTACAALATAFLLASPAAAEPGPALAVPVGIPLRLDGTVQPAEWSDAARVSLGPGNELWIKQHGSTLLLAFEADRAWPHGARAMLYLAPPSAEKGAMTPGTVVVEFEATEHDRPHLIVRREGEMGTERVLDRVVARARLTSAACSWEMALPLDLLAGAMRGRPIGEARAVVWWHMPDARIPATWPPGLNVRAVDRGLPPALVTDAGWAVLGGLGDPGVPPAFSATEWAELLADAAEMTRRGDEAHSHVRLLSEERRKSQKRDAETEAAVFDNLRWIASREALTARDRLTWAKALRWLNRHDAAAALQEAVISGPDRALAGHAAQERAETLDGAGRHREAAEAWQWLATRPNLGPDLAGHFERAAAASRAREEVVEGEASRRAAAAEAEGAPWLEVLTSRGTIVVALHHEDEPDLAAHVLERVGAGAYDGTMWHDVVAEASATGGWEPTREHGLDVPPEARDAGPVVPFRRRDPEERLFGYERGAVALVPRSGDTVGSTWRLLTGHRPDLALEAAPVVGHVVTGMDVLDRLAQGDRIVRVRVLRR